METICKINSGKTFTHATIGELSTFVGKQFIKECVGTTSCEISFGILNPGQTAPFFHSHKQNEEIYIVLRGAGDFQIDNITFPVAEGSIVRIATHSSRSLRCTSATSMLYICIQAKEGSLEQYTLNDGFITEQTPIWK